MKYKKIDPDFAINVIDTYLITIYFSSKVCKYNYIKAECIKTLQILVILVYFCLGFNDRDSYTLKLLEIFINKVFVKPISKVLNDVIKNTDDKVKKFTETINESIKNNKLTLREVGE